MSIQRLKNKALVNQAVKTEYDLLGQEILKTKNHYWIFPIELRSFENFQASLQTEQDVRMELMLNGKLLVVDEELIVYSGRFVALQTSSSNTSTNGDNSHYHH